jgi:hypothetical protein
MTKDKPARSLPTDAPLRVDLSPPIPATTQLWRLTGGCADGATRTVTFEWSGERLLSTEVVDAASLQYKANLAAGRDQPQMVTLALAEVSEDRGQSWRTILDRRDEDR